MLNLKVISSLIALVIFIKGYSQNITNPFETLKKKSVPFDLSNDGNDFKKLSIVKSRIGNYNII